jgi:hypothetical protein
MSAKQPAQKGTAKQPAGHESSQAARLQAEEAGGLELGAFASGLLERGLPRLPGHSTAKPLSQEALRQMQSRYGNAYVQRMLAQQGSDGPPEAAGHDPLQAGEAGGEGNSQPQPVPGRASSERASGRRVQRAEDIGTDDEEYIKLSVPDGPYVLEAMNAPGSASWELDYTNYLDIFATASQYEPKIIKGLDAAPHKIRDTDDGTDTGGKFNVVPGATMESTAGKGSAKVQAFRHGYVSDDDVIQARVEFDTVPLVVPAGPEEYVGVVVDMDPAHHDYIGMVEGTRINKELSSTLTVSDGLALTTSETVGATIGAEITSQLSGELSFKVFEDLGAKLGGSVGRKISGSVSASKTVSEQRTRQFQKSRTIKATYQFDKAGEYAIVPTCKVWRTPVTVYLSDSTGKVTGQKKAYIYSVIYNETARTVKAPGGKVDPNVNRKPVLEMSPEEFEKDPEAQRELYEMAKKTRDRMQAFGDNLLSEQEIKDGKVKSILKRDDFDEFVQGVIAKCKRNGLTKIGQMDDIVRGRFNLQLPGDVNKVVAGLLHQSQFPVKEVIAPRREQPGGGFGYPRWHVIFTDSESGLTHEWQVGTQAVTDVYETKGIKIPDGVNLPPGMKNDLHDIEYDIFYAGVRRKYPDVYKRHKLDVFHDKVDALSAEAGLKGKNTPDLKKKIGVLHKGAGDHLQALVDEFGPEWLEQFYH